MPAFTMIAPSNPAVVAVQPHLKAARERQAKVHKKSDLVLEWHHMSAAARRIFGNDLRNFLSHHKVAPGS